MLARTRASGTCAGCWRTRPRGLLDCVIAAVALRTGASLLCQDVDLVRVAEVAGIPLDAATPLTR